MVEVEGQAGQARMEDVALDSSEDSRGLRPRGACKVEVRTATFDEWAAEQQLDTVSVCKIDVEGFEESVLAGMHNSLQKRLLQAFVIERHVS